MADRSQHCNVYVMPSIVENHSSSLIEAKIVGAPCISSNVGGSFTLINHGKDGLLYNSLDSEMLAGYIISVLEDKKYAESLTGRREEFKASRLDDFGERMLEMYNELISK